MIANTKALITALVDEWYGTTNLKPTIQPLHEEIEEFEADHPEVPSCLWELVNHPVRIVRMWKNPELCVEIVVWWEESQSYRLIQDVCFKDAYPTPEEWYQAVLAIVKDPQQEVWIVRLD